MLTRYPKDQVNPPQLPQPPRFDIAFEHEPDPRGDRITIDMSGKVQPCKVDGNVRGRPNDRFSEP